MNHTGFRAETHASPGLTGREKAEGDGVSCDPRPSTLCYGRPGTRRTAFDPIDGSELRYNGDDRACLSFRGTG